MWNFSSKIGQFCANFTKNTLKAAKALAFKVFLLTVGQGAEGTERQVTGPIGY